MCGREGASMSGVGGEYGREGVGGSRREQRSKLLRHLVTKNSMKRV